MEQPNPAPNPAPEPEQGQTGTFEQQRARGHHYPLGSVQLLTQLVLQCSVSQRAAVAILQLLQPWLPGQPKAPHPNTARMWLLRLGLYELKRDKPKADDWVWLIDQTLQLGPFKALAIVGVRHQQWLQDRRPLRHQDLTLLHLQPMQSATAQAVHQAMQQTITAAGVPLQIVSDGGTELLKAITLLQQEHPQVISCADIKHKTALLLKKQLQADPCFAAFVQAANQARAAMNQTSLAHLVPPSLKTKARYLNLGAFIRWGQSTLRYLSCPWPVEEGEPVDTEKLQEKLGWLREYEQKVEQWSLLLRLAQQTEHYVRYHGYHCHAVRALKARQRTIATDFAAGEQMKEQLVQVVAGQSQGCRPHERRQGSTEVLESLFGKYKHLQRQHSKGGMTAMLLCIGTLLIHKTTDVLRTALESVAATQVAGWLRENLGATLQAKRRKALCKPEKRNKNSSKKRKRPKATV